jgi:hypothetical protein
VTTTIVFGAAGDGYVNSSDNNYTVARSGPGEFVGVGTQIFVGQKKSSGGLFTVQQGFIGFNFTAVPATEMVTAAHIQLKHAAIASADYGRDLYIRDYDWEPGGLTASDYRSEPYAGQLFGRIVGSNAVGATKYSFSGSAPLVDLLEGGNDRLYFSVHSSRLTGATAPFTGQDETQSFYSADQAGTADDPILAFTTVPRHGLIPCLGAVVQLSNGNLVQLFKSGTDILIRERDTLANTWTEFLPLGITSSTFYADTEGAQAFALAVDAADNVYVVGRNGANTNAISAQAYTKNPSAIGFSAIGPVRTINLPSYLDGRVNNVAATWHSTSGGTLVCLAAHSSGAAEASNTTDVAWGMFSSDELRSGVGTGVRGSGAAQGSLFPTRNTFSYFNTYTNDTGTGLDIVADRGNADQGYAYSFNRGTLLGQNDSHHVSRYILNATGSGFSHTSYWNSGPWATKDANAKLRVVSIGTGQVAVLSGDSDAGWGLSVAILQSTGTTAGFNELAYIRMDAEDIPGFMTPEEAALNSYWDAGYSVAENKLWIFYRQTGTIGHTRRTSIDLNTYQPTGVVETVWDHSGGGFTVESMRAPRNGWSGNHTWVQSGVISGALARSIDTRVVTFNVAPTAPTLTPRANYDATVAATFDWTFNDPNAGDTQSAYELEIEDQADASLDFDSGKTASATTERSLAGGTLVNGKSYRWRVRTWDALDVVSPWSDWGTFSTSAGGAVTITDPAVDNMTGVSTDDYLVKWNVTGTVQDSYRVILTRTDTGATVSDTGWVAGVVTQLLVGGMVSDVEHQVSVRVRNAALVESGAGTRLITPSYGTPETPVITVTAVPDDGYVLVEVDNPVPGQADLGTEEHDFEVAGDVAEWTGDGNGTLAHSVAQAHKGTGSMLVTMTGNPNQTIARSYTVDNVVPVVTGTRYRARMWAYRPVAGPVTIAIDWRAAGGVYLSSNATQVSLAAGTWTYLETVAPAPATAVEATFGPTIPAGQANGTEVYVDELVMTLASDRPDVTTNKVLRRRAGSQDPWNVVGEAGPDGSFRDYSAAGWVPWEYMVRGEA